MGGLEALAEECLAELREQLRDLSSCPDAQLVRAPCIVLCASMYCLYAQRVDTYICMHVMSSFD